jgi:uncharacterized protein
MNTNGIRAQPWYREPWPWILMAGPGIVVVAGFITAWLAVRSDDGLVLDDYYKQGLAINRTLGRNDAATRMGITAELYLIDGRVRVMLDRAGPGALTLQFAHPTRAGMDQRLQLTMRQPGVYEGQLQPLRAGRWHVVLEQNDWRLAGDWTMPATGALMLDTHTPIAVGEEYSKGGKR